MSDWRLARDALLGIGYRQVVSVYHIRAAVGLWARIEAVCYFKASSDWDTSPHAKEFESEVSRLIDLIEKAQQPDGYLNIYFTVVDMQGRNKNFRDLHEMCTCVHRVRR
jgi:DUF1680 family protein